MQLWPSPWLAYFVTRGGCAVASASAASSTALRWTECTPPTTCFGCESIAPRQPRDIPWQHPGQFYRHRPDAVPEGLNSMMQPTCRHHPKHTWPLAGSGGRSGSACRHE
eukprot:11698455-Alexandrium_andersonii.AAC.1